MNPFSTEVAVFASLLISTMASLIIVTIFCHRKVEQGQAVIRSGIGRTRVAFDGIFVLPIIHRIEYIDISVKRVEIVRCESAGVLCKDNIRADIKANFFLRVNKTAEDVLLVAQAIGCHRASNAAEIRALFDARFSDSIKTIIRRYDFAALHEHRDQLRDAIVEMTGGNLNGFVLVDCSIDYLEQTAREHLNPESVLDAEGIKKIAQLTATQIQEANRIENEKALAIKRQDADREKEVARQDEEIKQFKSQQAAETAKIEDEERKVKELIKIKNDLELAVERDRADRQKAAEKIAGEQAIHNSQINFDRERDQAKIESEKSKELATKEKERLILEKQKAIEVERIENEKSKELAAKEKERLVLEKQRGIDIEKIESERLKEVAVKDKERLVLEKQQVIEIERIENEKFKELAAKEKERLVLEKQKAIETEKKAIADAQQLRKNDEAIAEAERDNTIAVRQAEALAQRKIIESSATEKVAEKEAAAIKHRAAAKADDAAAVGLGEARVIKEKHLAEAEGFEAKAAADARGIREKADAMKQFDAPGQTHEEFKLRLEHDQAIALAQLEAQRVLARDQASVLAEALKHAKIDLVGGEAQFIDRVVSLVGHGKAIDSMIQSSTSLNGVKETLINGGLDRFAMELKSLVMRFGLGTEDVKNLTISAAIGKYLLNAKDVAATKALTELLVSVSRAGFATHQVDGLLSS